MPGFSELSSSSSNESSFSAPPAAHDAGLFSRGQQLFVWLTGIFLTSLLVANLVGAMLFSFEVPVLGVRALLSAGIIAFPVTFLLTDLLNEFYGARGARQVTLVGFGMSILVYVYLWVGQQLPVDAGTLIPKSHYLNLAQQYTGMFMASLTAYLLGQLLDIHLFGLFKGWTQHRFIWLRATGSTVVSQLFDSLVVTSLAFWGSKPLSVILHIAASNYSWKFVIAVCITPVLYLGHTLMRAFLKDALQAPSQPTKL